MSKKERVRREIAGHVVIEQLVPGPASDYLKDAGSRGVRRYIAGRLTILISRDPRGGGPLRWHLSISHPERLPTWEEVRDARYVLLDKNLYFVMLLPPPEEYVNVHEYTFHLWETDDKQLTAPGN